MPATITPDFRKQCTAMRFGRRCENRGVLADGRCRVCSKANQVSGAVEQNTAKAETANSRQSKSNWNEARAVAHLNVGSTPTRPAISKPTNKQKEKQTVKDETKKEIGRMIEAHDGQSIDMEVAVMVAIHAEVGELIQDKWQEIRKAANEVFAANEDQAAPVAKASISIEVDYTDKAKPKLTTSISWNVKKKTEREREIEDPRQGKLEYVPAK